MLSNSKRILFFVPVVALFFLVACNRPAEPVGETVSFVGNEDSVADTVLLKQKSAFSFEVTDESLIGRMERVVKSGGHYYVLDKQTRSVLVFDETGRYVRTIGRLGGGVGEYAALRDMAVDVYSHRVWLLVEPAAVYCYRLDGSFEKSFRLKEPANALAVDEQYIYLNNVTFINNERMPYSLTVMDKNGELRQQLLPTLDEIAPYCYYAGNSLSGIGDGIVYTRRFDDSVYRLADGKVDVRWAVAWNRLQFPDSEKDKTWDCNDLNKFCWEDKHVYTLTNIQEGNDFVLFRSNLLGTFVLDKSRKEITYYTMIEQTDLHIPLPNYLPVEGEGDEVFFVYPAYRLDDLKALLEKRDTPLPDTYKKLISSMDAESNPLIFRYSLK